MSSFRQRLTKSGKEVLDSRAQNLLNRIKMAEDAYLQKLKTNLLNLKGELDKLNDVGPTSRMSLNPGEGIDPETWVKQRHELQLKIREAKIKLFEAMKVDKEEFPEEDFEDMDELLGLNDLNDFDALDEVATNKKKATKAKAKKEEIGE